MPLSPEVSRYLDMPQSAWSFCRKSSFLKAKFHANERYCESLLILLTQYAAASFIISPLNTKSSWDLGTPRLSLIHLLEPS